MTLAGIPFEVERVFEVLSTIIVGSFLALLQVSTSEKLTTALLSVTAIFIVARVQRRLILSPTTATPAAVAHRCACGGAAKPDSTMVTPATIVHRCACAGAAKT